MARLSNNPAARKQKIMGTSQTLTREEFKSRSRLERIRLIQELIPIGLMAVAEELQREIGEVISSSGNGPDGKPRVVRYGYNEGSVVLDHRRIPIRVPRVRGQEGEIPLESYDLLRNDYEQDSLYNSLLRGVSCRDFESTKREHKGSIGTSKSTVSRQFAEMTQKQLEIFQGRLLKDYDIIGIFIDGKSFASDQMVIALGITIEGKKVVLGFVQTATENAQSVGLFLQSLVERGLDISRGILAITDGSKGFIKALKDVFKGKVAIQRCQWHKRENVLSYLSKNDKPQMKALLQAAYERPTYVEAKEALQGILHTLNRMNQNASASLTEGLEDTLTLHRLDVFGILGKSFKTTNCLESINSQAEDFCAKVRKWSNSSQKCRWMGAALTEIEPSLRRIKGHDQLPKLRVALKKELQLE